MSPRVIFRKRYYNHKIDDLQNQIYGLYLAVGGLAAIIIMQSIFTQF